MVRRTALESVDGFRPLQNGNPLPRRLQEDYLLSRRIAATGQKATWWLGAPVYHYPRFTLAGLERQHFRLGKGNAFTERYYDRSNQFFKTLAKGLFGAPVVGLLCSIRFKNPWHVLLFPLTKYAQLVGYLYGMFAYEKSTTGYCI